jgi:hypothetical protein
MSLGMALCEGLMAMNEQIAHFEKNENWRATAKHADGREIAVMRGAPDGPFAGNYYLYDEDWDRELRAAHFVPTLQVTEMKPYSSKQIKGMFASGELSLVNGKIPD